MTNFSHSERVQASGVVGHSYDTDDQIEDLDIYEALVNPHDAEGGSKKGGAGGPGMMPPPMGGAGSRPARRGRPRAQLQDPPGPPRVRRRRALAPERAGSARPVSQAQEQDPTGCPGSAAAARVGSAALSSGGLGSSAASNFSMPTFGTSAAGVTDPSTTGFDLPSYTGTTPGGYTLPSPGTNPGSGGIPTVPGGGSGSGSWSPPATPNLPSTGSVPPSAPSAPTFGGGGMPSRWWFCRRCRRSGWCSEHGRPRGRTGTGQPGDAPQGGPALGRHGQGVHRYRRRTRSTPCPRRRSTSG